MVAATARPGSRPDLGGFGGVFDPRAAGFADPLLVAATDGVGTKLLLGMKTGRLRGLGIDLVAMCVNDLIVQGATPLFFLDYYATGKLDIEGAATVVAGIADGCRLAGCALIGGETAEMPGLYGKGDFDLAGFAVGAVERGSLLPRATEAGDRLLALPSSGVHANGFSLVRRIVEQEGLALDGPAPFEANGATLGEALCTPTTIYAKAGLLAAADPGLHAMAHVTGGGLVENLPRVMGKGQVARIDAGSWALPGVFGWLAKAGGLSDHELARTFNCGIGMVLMVAKDRAAVLKAALEAAGERVLEIGEIVAGEAGAEPCVRIDGTKENWPCAASPS